MSRGDRRAFFRQPAADGAANAAGSAKDERDLSFQPAGHRRSGLLRDDIGRAEMLQEIGLAERHALRAKDRIGHADMEEEIGKGESGQIGLAGEAEAEAAREQYLDLAILAA